MTRRPISRSCKLNEADVVSDDLISDLDTGSEKDSVCSNNVIGEISSLLM